MADKKTEMSFGPAWIKALQDPGKSSTNQSQKGDSHISSLSSLSSSSSSSHSVIKLRYTMDELIAGFNPRKCRPPADLSEHEECFIPHLQEPLFLSPLSQQEAELFSTNINYEFIQKKANKLENGGEYGAGIGPGDNEHKFSNYRDRAYGNYGNNQQSDGGGRMMQKNSITGNGPDDMMHRSKTMGSGGGSGGHMGGNVIGSGGGHSGGPGSGQSMSGGGGSGMNAGSKLLFDRNNSIGQRQSRMSQNSSGAGPGQGSDMNSRFGFGNSGSSNSRGDFQRAMSYDESKLHSQGGTGGANSGPIQKKLSYPKVTNPADLSDTLLPSWRTNKTTAQATGTSTTVTSSSTSTPGADGSKPEWRQSCDSSKNWRTEPRTPGKKETDPDDPSTDPQAIEYLNRKRAAQTKVTNARFITRRDDMMDLFKKADTFDSADERDFFGNPLGSGNSGGPGNFGGRTNTGGEYSRKPPGMGRSNYGQRGDRQGGDYPASDKWGNYNQKSSDRGENGGQRFGSQYGGYNRYPSFNRNNSQAGGQSGSGDFDDYRNTGSDDDDSRRNIPEWSKDDGSGFDFGKVGTFDDTGAFCEVGDDFGGALEPENDDKNDNEKADETDRPGSSASGKTKENESKAKESQVGHQQSTQVQSSANKSNPLSSSSAATESDAKQFERITRSVAEIDMTDEELTADIINSIFKNDMIAGNFEPEKDPFVNKGMFGDVGEESKGFFSDFESQFAFGSPVKPSSLSHAAMFNKVDAGPGPASFVHHSPVQEKLGNDFDRSPFDGPGAPGGRAFMQAEADETLLPDSEWFYCDPAGRIQGPFKSQEMDDWYRNGFFSMDLMLRRATENTFKTLGELFDAYGGKVPFCLPRLVSPPPAGQPVAGPQPIAQPQFGPLGHEHLDEPNSAQQQYMGGFPAGSMSPGFKNPGQQYAQQQQAQQHKYPGQQQQNAPSPMMMAGPPAPSNPSPPQQPQDQQQQRNQHDINMLMSHFTETRIRGHAPPFHELSPFFRIPETEVHEQLNFICEKFLQHRAFAALSDLDKQGAVFEKFVSLHQEAAIRKAQQQQQQQKQQQHGNFSQPDGAMLSRQGHQQQIPDDHHIRMQQQQEQHNEQPEAKQMPQMNQMMPPRMSMPGAMSLEELEEMQKREAEEQYKKQQQLHQQQHQQQQQQQHQFPAQDELNEEDEGFQMVEQRSIKRGKKAANDKPQKETAKPAVQAPAAQSQSQAGGKVSIIQAKPDDRDDGLAGTEAFQQFAQEQLSQQSGNQKQTGAGQAAQKCVWGTGNTEDVSQESLSLTEIQRLQEEKEREELERRKKMNEQMALLAGSNANNTTEGHFKWAHNWKDQSSAGQKVKTLAEIQAEESEKAAIIREQQEAEAARRIAAGSGITPMSSIVAKAAGGSGPAPGMPWGLQQQQQGQQAQQPQQSQQQQRPYWNDSESLSRNLQMPMKTMTKAAKVPADCIRQYLKSSPRNVIKLEEQHMMKCSVESIDDLCRCSVEILEKAFENVQATAFINIAKDASTANEFVEYVQYYLGQNESARAFCKFFVNKKSYLNKKPAAEKPQQQQPQPQPAPSQQNVKKNMWDEESTPKATNNKSNYAQQKAANAQQKTSQPAAQQMAANSLSGDFDIMNQNTETMKEFDAWCVEVLHQIDPVLDAETFVNFLKEIDSPDEIGEYVRGYLGSNKQSRDFTKNFLSKRSYLRNKNRDDELDEDLCAPAQALTPGKSDDSGFVTVNNNGKKKRKPKAAGKENSAGGGNNLPTIRTITLD